MNKIICTFVLFLIIPLVEPNNCSKIPWSDSRMLEWSDFIGDVPLDRGLKTAMSSVQIEMDGEVFEGEIPDLSIVAYFIKENSWTSTMDQRTLLHEQLHFDIAELFARKIRKEFDSLVKHEISDFSIYLEVYNQYLEKHKNHQKRYDSEVYFNEEQQDYWIINTKKELDSLDEYINKSP